jgi:hypothetical protein
MFSFAASATHDGLQVPEGRPKLNSCRYAALKSQHRSILLSNKK